MKQLLLAGMVAACSSKTTDHRCNTFATRVVECAMDPRVTPALSADERANIKSMAYGACTKTTHDEATLHYYGDVDRKIKCMEEKDCAGVRACLVADDPPAK